jgi:serine/threonine protein kinase
MDIINQFNNIKKIGEGGFSTVYSAIWKDGLLKYDRDIKEYKRNKNTKVALKYLKDSQSNINEFLNEV